MNGVLFLMERQRKIKGCRQGGKTERQLLGVSISPWQKKIVLSANIVTNERLS